MPLPWLIPLAMTGIAAYQAFKSPQNTQMRDYVNQLKRRSKQGIGMAERERLYGAGSRQIAGEFGQYRQTAGAQSAAMGVGRSSTATGAISQINAQQSGALSNLRGQITQYDQSVKNNALAALGEAVQANQQANIYKQGIAGQGLGQSLSALQSSLFPAQNPFGQPQFGYNPQSTFRQPFNSNPYGGQY